MTLARATGHSPGDLAAWHPRDLATLADQLEEEAAARKRGSG